MFKQIRIIQIFTILILLIQIGFAQEKVMIKYNSNGSIFTTKISNLDSLNFSENYVEDIDGNVYKTVIIGNQEWMAENLRVTHYNNHTQWDPHPIPLLVDNDDWGDDGNGAYCFNKNNIFNVITYGCLYNWHAVSTGRLAPDPGEGWRVPSHEDWQYLENFLSGDGHSGSEANALKSTKGWSNTFGTNNYGFNAIGSSFRHPNGGFGDGSMGNSTGFWLASGSSTEPDQLHRLLRYNVPTIPIPIVDSNKNYGYKIRCMRDISNSVTDIDGNVYKTVNIDGQEWMAENLKVTHYRNGDEIPNITDNGTWSSTTGGAYCYNNNDIGNKDQYGCLYNWFVTDDSRNIAPVGWRVPSHEDWQYLENFLSGDGHSGSEARALKSKTGWDNYPGADGTNNYGFSAIASNFRHPTAGFGSGSMGNSTGFWLASGSNSKPDILHRLLRYNDNTIPIPIADSNKKYGYKIRCIKIP